MIAALYVSKALVAFEPPDLIELQARAEDFNRDHGISGYLFFDKEYFFQYIEGEESSIQNLMGKIALDPRHEVIHTQYLEDQEARRFPDWSMRLLKTNLLIEIGMDQTILHYMLLAKDEWFHSRVPVKETTIRLLDSLVKYRSYLSA